MPEILTPIQEQPQQEKEIRIQDPITEEQMNPKNVEFLAYLGLKDEMFNSRIMEKISYLSERINLEGLKILDLRFGNDGHISKLDKILMHIKLTEQEHDYKERLNLINAQKNAI